MKFHPARNSWSTTTPPFEFCPKHDPSMQIITSVISDFDELVRGNDWEIISRFLYYYHTAERQMIPESVDGIGQKIGRGKNQISIELFDTNKRHVARFCFVPSTSVQSSSFTVSHPLVTTLHVAVHQDCGGYARFRW
jgi:hypothetical protein